MKELIEQVDRLLAVIPVNGDAVFLMADARKALEEAYRMAKAWTTSKKEDVGK